MPKIDGPSDVEMRRYRAEDALRTLSRAEEIRRDSKLMADVKRHASEQMANVAKVIGKDQAGMKPEKGLPEKGKMPKMSGKVPVAKAQGPRSAPSKVSPMGAAKKKVR